MPEISGDREEGWKEEIGKEKEEIGKEKERSTLKSLTFAACC